MQLLSSGLPFGPILNLIDARSIPIIGVRFPSSRSVLDARALNARNTRSLNVLNACGHGCACHCTTIIVLAMATDRERLRLTEDVFLYFLRNVFPFHFPRRIEIDVTINRERLVEQLLSNKFLHLD